VVKEIIDIHVCWDDIRRWILSIRFGMTRGIDSRIRGNDRFFCLLRFFVIASDDSDEAVSDSVGEEV
jgi:hypothetical protein